MNKTHLPYSRALYAMGLVNPSLMALSLMFSFNLAFPETYLHAFFFSFLSLVPMLAVKIISERTENKTIRCVSALLFIALSFLVPGEVMRPSWIIMLTIFSFVFVFCPHIEGRTMMTKAHIWDIIPLFGLYILSQILSSPIMITASTLLILTFILEFMLEKNMEGVRKEVMSRECRVGSDGMIRANRRVIILFIALYLALCLLIPAGVKLLSREREETEVEYTFSLEKESVTEEKTPLERKEIRLSKKAADVDFTPLGTLLLYLFLALVGSGVILFFVALFYRLFSTINSGRRRKSSLNSDDGITESGIVEERKKKEREEKPGYFTPEGRIRRLYRGLVLSREEERRKLRTMTCGEIGKDASLEEDVTELYERTRYSEEKMDRESVRRMQMLIRENKKSSK